MIPREDTWGHYDRQHGRSWLFRDRTDAGVQLAQALMHLRATQPLVLGIPRGGVPVAREVAVALGAELDVIVARKLGAPGQEELAIGAVAADGTTYINREIVALLRVEEQELQRILRAQRAEAERRERRFRGDRPAPHIQDRTVILVDDGLATGATMRAAVRALRAQHPKRLVAAVPVGSPDTCASLSEEVDELVCPEQPTPLYSVGQHYEHFDQTSDEEVLRILQASRAAAKGGG